MISPLHMLALDSDVCPTSVPSPVAPLNTYTFLKTFDSRLALERRVGTYQVLVGTCSTEGLPVKTAKPTANYERDDHPYTTTLSGRRISFAFGGICRTSRK